DPINANVHFNLGRALSFQNKWDEAVACYRKAIELDPKHVKAHSNLGAILCDVRGEYENAAACFRKAIELDPKSAIAHHTRDQAPRGVWLAPATGRTSKLSGLRSGRGAMLLKSTTFAGSSTIAQDANRHNLSHKPKVIRANGDKLRN